MSYAHAYRDSDDVGATWIRNVESWFPLPHCATMGRPEREETPMNTTTTPPYEGRRVETEYGPGVILTLTGRSVVIELDQVEYDLIPTGTQARISIVRGSYGWDRWVHANREALA